MIAATPVFAPAFFGTPFALMLAAILLCGCSLGAFRLGESSGPPQTGADGSRLPQPSGSAQSSAPSGGAAGPAEIFATRTQDAPPSPTEQEVLYAYDRAVEAYGWFSLNTLPSSGSLVEQNGGQYQRVDRNGISSLEELRTYLGDLFSEQLIDRLLPQDAPAPLYCDIGGRLYVRPAARGADPHKGAVTVSVRQESETARSVNVTVELLGDDLTTVTGVEMDSFPYELTDGRWVFTDFYLVR